MRSSFDWTIGRGLCAETAPVGRVRCIGHSRRRNAPLACSGRDTAVTWSSRQSTAASSGVTNTWMCCATDRGWCACLVARAKRANRLPAPRYPALLPPSHEFEERAVFAGRLVLLVKKRPIVRIELLEPLIPVDLSQSILARAAGEVDPQNTNVVTSANDGGWRTVVFLDPAPDLIVIGCGVCLDAPCCGSS